MREFMQYGKGSLQKKQAIFASVFVIQNRLQTACEKLQREITMRQWLLLAMTEVCEEPRTLTNVGRLMGCSRQNVKNLAAALEKKNFVRLISGANNSVLIEPTETAREYLLEMAEKQGAVMRALFSPFTDEETDALFGLQNKLLDGVKEVEDYAENEVRI